jgi:hypothetical protein
MAVAAVGVSYVSGAQAAQQQSYRPAAAPIQRAAPAFTPRPAPQMNINRPVQVGPRFTQPQNINRNFHAVNPSLQRVNPNVRLNNPSLQHVNPNVRLNNPSLQHVNPNVRLNNPSFQHVNPNAQKFNPNLAQPKVGLPLQGGNNLKLGPGKPNFSPVLMKPGPGGPHQIRPAFPAVSMQNKFWPILKGPKFIWFGGHRRFFVPIGLLGVALIGGSYWYPDGYVSIEGPACTGFTPDGCQLHWRMVDFEDGGAEPQCVQYCPQVGPPPTRAVPLPPALAFSANGVCQLTIFSEPNFSGLSAPTGDSQPDLSQAGWRNEISSLQVQAGTWEFFSEDNFGGESLRLSAGPYPMLAPEWSKRIGSFMCVQPGAPGA